MYGDYDKTDYVIYDQEQLQNNQNLAQYNSEQNSHRADSSEQVGQNTSEYVYVDQVQYDNGYTTDYQYAAPAQNPSLTDFIDEFWEVNTVITVKTDIYLFENPIIIFFN